MTDTAIIAGMIRDDAVIAKILAKLAHPHPCPDCGEQTSASLCARCTEWAARTLESEPRHVS